MEQRQGNKIKQGTAYVFLLQIPHIPNHSAVGHSYSTGIVNSRQTQSAVQPKNCEESGAEENAQDEFRYSERSLSRSQQEQGDPNAEADGGRTFAAGVQDVLEGMLDHITQPTWLQDFSPDKRGGGDKKGSKSNAAGHIVIFTTQYVDLVLNRLKRFGVGTTDHGTMTIFPSSLQYTGGPGITAVAGTGERLVDASDLVDGDAHDDTNFVSNFLNSVNSRVVVEEVISNVRAGAIFSFDYLLLVIVASMIAGVGLGSNNVVAIVASMLVSPIMGPILAITFGITTLQKDLIFIGLRTELISLFLCILMGSLVAFGMHLFGAPKIFKWPTNEMGSRGEWTGILVSVFIALPSGVGVALSVLGNNTSSLVGVAISASLLPPAVNTGMCIAYYLISLNDPELSTAALGKIGGISFLLTLLNIVIIVCMALLIFKIKEVFTIPGDSLFWANDIQAFRNATNAIKNKKEGEKMLKKIKNIMQEGKFGNTMQNFQSTKYNLDNSLGTLSHKNVIEHKNRGVRDVVDDRTISRGMLKPPKAAVNIFHFVDRAAKDLANDQCGSSAVDVYSTSEHAGVKDIFGEPPPRI